MESWDVGKLEQFLYHNYTYLHCRELALKRGSDIFICNKCQVRVIICFVEQWKFIPHRKQTSINNDDFPGSRFEAYALFSIKNRGHIFCSLGTSTKASIATKAPQLWLDKSIRAFCSVYSQLIRRKKSSTIVMEQTNKLFTCTQDKQ